MAKQKKAPFPRKGEVLLLALCGISIAPRAQIWIYMYIIFLVRCRSHFMCEYRLPIGKYRAALRHIDCAEGANIDLHIVPSSTADATAVPRSSAEPPPFRHAKSVPPFPLSGKSTPQSSAKPSGRRSVRRNTQLVG